MNDIPAPTHAAGHDGKDQFSRIKEAMKKALRLPEDTEVVISQQAMEDFNRILAQRQAEGHPVDIESLFSAENIVGQRDIEPFDVPDHIKEKMEDCEGGEFKMVGFGDPANVREITVSQKDVHDLIEKVKGSDHTLKDELLEMLNNLDRLVLHLYESLVRAVDVGKGPVKFTLKGVRLMIENLPSEGGRIDREALLRTMGEMISNLEDEDAGEEKA